MTAIFFDDIIAFKEMMYQQRSAEPEKELKRRKREVMQAQKRIVELDRIFKLIVHAPEKVDGKRVQKVDIVFNFVGEINFLSATQPKRQGA